MSDERAELIASLPSIFAQFEKNLENAISKCEEARKAWDDAKNDAVFQTGVEELRTLFCDEEIGGVTYEKKWSVAQLLEFIKSCVAQHNLIQTHDAKIQAAAAETLTEFNANGGKLTEADLAVFKWASENLSVQSWREGCAQVVKNCQT